jgi:N-acetylglucosamine-6-phosphate deacetylase
MPDSSDSIITPVTETSPDGRTAGFVAPGLVDIQVNGFAGVDFNDPAIASEAFAGSIQRLFQTGVTRFLPTVITAAPERIIRALRRLAAAKLEFRRSGMPEADAIAGFHVEGPHISPEDGPRGAHPREHVRPPDLDEFQRWQEAAGGEIRIVTLSPEYEEAPRYISTLVDSGVVVAIGHTRATSEQIRAAVDAGATISTHLGNGAHPVLHKTSNYIWDQLAEERLSASFIVDGIHLPQNFVAAAIRCKGPRRSILITDALMVAMCKPGLYQVGEVPVELRPDNHAVVSGTTRLAGSSLSMSQAVANCVRLTGVSLTAAVAMASVNPARSAGIAGRQQDPAPAEKADTVRFRWDESSWSFDVLETIVAGRTVYRAS